MEIVLAIAELVLVFLVALAVVFGIGFLLRSKIKWIQTVGCILTSIIMVGAAVMLFYILFTID